MGVIPPFDLNSSRGRVRLNLTAKLPVNSLLFAYRVFAIFSRFGHNDGHATIAQALPVKDRDDHLKIVNVNVVTPFDTK